VIDDGDGDPYRGGDGDVRAHLHKVEEYVAAVQQQRRADRGAAASAGGEGGKDPAEAHAAGHVTPDRDLFRARMRVTLSHF
jgi:hypothetical protein